MTSKIDGLERRLDKVIQETYDEPWGLATEFTLKDLLYVKCGRHPKSNKTMHQWIKNLKLSKRYKH